VWGDDERCLDTYWRFPGVWVHGDWARIDEDGAWFLLGRSDDTLSVADGEVGGGGIRDRRASTSPNRPRSAHPTREGRGDLVLRRPEARPRA
jgi:hypothetical protein